MPKDIKIRILSESKSKKSILRRQLMNESKDSLIDRIILEREGMSQGLALNAAAQAFSQSVLQGRQPSEDEIETMNKAFDPSTKKPFVSTLANAQPKAVLKKAKVRINSKGEIEAVGRFVSSPEGGTEMYSSGPGIPQQSDEPGRGGRVPPMVAQWSRQLGLGNQRPVERLPTADEAAALAQWCELKGMTSDNQTPGAGPGAFSAANTICRKAHKAAEDAGTSLEALASGQDAPEFSGTGQIRRVDSCSASPDCNTRKAIRVTRKLLRRHGVSVQDLVMALLDRGENQLTASSGEVDSDLIDAIVRFQADPDNGLKPDGMAGRKTLGKLGISKKRRRGRKVSTKKSNVLPKAPEETPEQEAAYGFFTGSNPEGVLKKAEFERALRDYAAEYQRRTGSPKGIETIVKRKSIQINAGDRFYGENQGNHGAAIPREWKKLSRSQKSLVVRYILGPAYRR